MSQFEQEPKTALPEPDNEDDMSDSGGEEEEQLAAPEASNPNPNRYEKLERLKREKRLAMNRECARARRRRKKLRMELLDARVQELNQKNTRIQDENSALRARVMQLEAELGAAKSTAGLDASSFMGGMGGNMNSMGSPGLSAGGYTPDTMSSQALIAEKLSLQRRTALAGFGGSAGAPTSSLGGFMGSMGAGGMSDQASALRYMQLMQAKSAMGGAGDQGKASFMGGAPARSSFTAISLLQRGGSTDAPTDLLY